VLKLYVKEKNSWRRPCRKEHSGALAGGQLPSSQKAEMRPTKGMRGEGTKHEKGGSRRDAQGAVAINETRQPYLIGPDGVFGFY